jgi:hypothetical protein
MNRPSKSLALSAVVLLLTTHPLPAPIFEPSEKAAATPNPKSKPAEKPSAKSAAKARPVAAKPAPPPATPAKRSRFAGTWVGTMQAFPVGNVAIVLAVDSNEKSATMTWAGEKPASGKVEISGDALQASFPGPFGSTKWTTWTLTPQPDAATARVRMQAFMNDFTAVFHRTVVASSDGKPAR